MTSDWQGMSKPSADDDKYEKDRGMAVRLVCVMCDAPMRRVWKSSFWKHLPPFRGWKGNDWFCSMRCAADWGVLKCSAGTDSDCA